MARRGAKWQLVAVVTVATCLGGAALGHAQFTSFSDHKRALLEGNWQSCREGDGRTASESTTAMARHRPLRAALGPFHEFAFFRGIQDEHRDHNSAGNLLKPYNLEIRANAARQSWDVDGMRLEIALAGGAREQCESWFVSLKRAETTVSH
jgi:hypothetical protein